MNNRLLLTTLFQDLVEKGYPIKIKGKGLSMFPFILPGSKVFIRPVALASLVPGDIIVVDFQGEWIGHRYLGLMQGNLLTKGDAVNLIDPPQPSHRLIGRVYGAKIGNVTWPIEFLTSIYLFLFNRTDPPLNRKIIIIISKGNYWLRQFFKKTKR